jgi:FkbM family methyltransferase
MNSLDPIDPDLVNHCCNILHQYASWVHGLPELAHHKSVPKLHQIADVLGHCAESYRRTYKPTGGNGSQCEEDAIIEALFPPPMVGSYIDIGAGEPMQCSNTWALYQRGWRGLLVEPLPMFVCELIRWRPGDIVFPVAASNRTGVVPFYIDGSVSSCLSDWSTNSPCKAQAVECVSIAEILNMPDFRRLRDSCTVCSIDVEGHEPQVLSAIPWDTFRPQAFCVEYRKYDSDSMGADLSDQWEPILLAHGYALHAVTGMNKIYVVPELAATPYRSLHDG